MKTTLNLASRHNRTQHLAAMIARPLLPLMACWLIYLLISQGLLLNRQKALKQELAALDAEVVSSTPQALGNLSAKDYQRQETAIAFINGLAARDRFSWIDLLGRLEETLTKGVSLSQIAPNYQQRSLQLTGLAENVQALRGYLSSLLRSDSLAAAYLLQQDSRKIKDRYGREHRAVTFSIEIQKAF